MHLAVYTIVLFRMPFITTYSVCKNMTEMIQQSALSIAKQPKKQKTPKISSPTRALMKTIQKKAKEDIRKHNLDEIRETIESSKNLKRSEEHTAYRKKKRMITLLDKQGKDIQEQDKIMERIE